MLTYRRFVVLAALLAAVAVPLQAASPANKGSLTKAEIRQAEQRLADLGYWTGPIDGVWDGVSRSALVAFQKLQHARATGQLTRAEHNALSMSAPPRPRELGGAHIEVDLAHQVLFLVDG